MRNFPANRGTASRRRGEYPLPLASPRARTRGEHSSPERKPERPIARVEIKSSTVERVANDHRLSTPDRQVLISRFREAVIKELIKLGINRDSIEEQLVGDFEFNATVAAQVPTSLGGNVTSDKLAAAAAKAIARAEPAAERMLPRVEAAEAKGEDVESPEKADPAGEIAYEYATGPASRVTSEISRDKVRTALEALDTGLGLVQSLVAPSPGPGAGPIGG